MWLCVVNVDAPSLPSLSAVGRQHSLPQSPTMERSRDLVRDFSGGRKTVRFADERPSAPDGSDLGLTIRPHYPTRVCLSTFHSNPTITSEL